MFLSTIFVSDMISLLFQSPIHGTRENTVASFKPRD